MPGVGSCRERAVGGSRQFPGAEEEEEEEEEKEEEKEEEEQQGSSFLYIQTPDQPPHGGS